MSWFSQLEPTLAGISPPIGGGSERHISAKTCLRLGEAVLVLGHRVPRRALDVVSSWIRKDLSCEEGPLPVCRKHVGCSRQLRWVRVRETDTSDGHRQLSWDDTCAG